MKKLIKLVSMVLCASLAISIPIEAYGAVSQQSSPQEVVFDGVSAESEEVSNIISELVSERTETSKVFLLDDGSKLLAEYNQPVHYKDEKGKYVDYDNTLVAVSSATPDEAAEGELSAKSSDASIKLSNKAKKNNMVKLSSGDYSISWGYEGVSGSKSKAVKNYEKPFGNEKFTTLKKAVSETVYENAFKNVDLQYFISPAGVKENIILKSSDVQNEFTINYKIVNLTAVQKDDSTILLNNKNSDEIYRITAPYMIDAKGNQSSQLKIKIESQNGGNLKVKLTADYWFIHGIGRSFPISIDPEITKKLNSALQFDELEGTRRLNHGGYYLDSTHSVLAMHNSFTSLADGEQVISAKYHFEATNSATLFSSEQDDPIIVNVRRVNSFSGNGVNLNSEVVDYDSLTYNDNHDLTFDLTKLYKEWITNSSTKAFVLEAADTAGTKTVNIKSATPSSVTPSLTLIYRDFKGTAGSMSAHTFDVGQNATASVSDYLGSLSVTQTIYEGTGTRMPASVSVTYNSFTDTWHFSHEQKITAVTNSSLTAAGYNYIYTDSSGANHYLKKDDESNEWYDEDGIGVSLTVNDNDITLENSNTQTYQLPANGGKLLSEKDENNNTIVYTYSGNTLSSITDGSGRVISFSGSTITLPDSNTVDLSYTSGALSSVSFADGRMSKFGYTGGKLTSVMQADTISGSESENVKTTFTFTDGKVTNVSKYGSDNTLGNYIDIVYGNDNTTEFTDKQGREVTYTFDNEGNKISVLNANGYLETSDSDGLTVSSGAESFTKNYITESTEQSVVGSGYYTYISGSYSGTPSTGGAASIDSNQSNHYFGTTSIKVDNTASGAFFTGAFHEFVTTDFNGNDVTFSAYIKTDDVAEVYSDNTVGAMLKIKGFDADGGRTVEKNSIALTGTEGWQRLSISANIPSDTVRFRVYCMVRYASGTAWFDCLQLEDGNCANDFNALQNTDFSTADYWKNEENNSVTVSDGTVTIGGAAGAYDDAEAEEATEEEYEEATYATYTEVVTEPTEFGNINTYDNYGNVIKTEQGMINRTVRKTYIVEPTEATQQATVQETTVAPTEETTTGSNNQSDNSLGNKYIYQEVEVGRAGVAFNLVGEAIAKSVPLSNEKRTFGIALKIYYDDNTLDPETHYQEFNSNITKKQTVNLAVYPEIESAVINKVAFAFVYGYNKNEMIVHNAMLNIADLGYTLGTVTEQDDTEPEVVIDKYISYRIISESLDTNCSYMCEIKTYDSTGNYVVTENDESGAQKFYTYDVNGNTTSVTNMHGDEIEYQYDVSGNVTYIGESVTSGPFAGSEYSYNGAGYLSAIDHNNFRYSFNYDVFGKLISTAIANTAVSTNTYDNSGRLTKTLYANGDYFEYTYDSYDNVLTVTAHNHNVSPQTTGLFAEFIYNKKGMVAKSIDYSSGTTTYYYYDFSGTATREYRQNGNESLSYHIGYDSDGNRVEKTAINGYVKTITTGTDEDGKFIDNDGVRVSSTTDDFGRTTETVTKKNNLEFNTEYDYSNGTSTNSTTNNVSSLTQKLGNSTLVTYEYEYDEDGNISKIYETNGNGSAVLSNEYYYDSLNELEIINDRKNGIYTHYTYDKAGNVTEIWKREYDANGVPASTISRDTFAYEQNGWNDRLINYNNSDEDITYDLNGNPLQYRDGMLFTWINGRRLNTVTYNNITLSFEYDNNGMRTRKGNTRYYYDSSNNLVGMTKNNKTLFFYYDESGAPTSFSYNGLMHYYIKNLQGDIMKIVNSQGETVASYAYDVSGKLLYIKNYYNALVTDPNHIGMLNPLRYRGYVYDDETGLYYLQSRYYDPVTTRFINADVYCDTNSGSPLSTNMYSYCENDAVFRSDPSGKWFYHDYQYYKYILRLKPMNELFILSPSLYSLLNDTYVEKYYFLMGVVAHFCYNANSLMSYYELIFGQGLPEIKNLKFGDSTVGSSGCGAVAIYNTFKLLGIGILLSSVIMQAELNGLLSFFGYWGMWDSSISSFLDAYSIKYSTYTDYDKYTKEKTSYRISIIKISTDNIFSGHFFCLVKKSDESNNLYSLNYYNNQKDWILMNLNLIKDKFELALCIK